MMALETMLIDTIVTDPSIRGGRPHIRGTGLTVADVYLTHTTGDCLSAEQIAEHYDISLGEVYAALAYFYMHQSEIEERIEADERLAEQLGAELEAAGKLKRLE
jgi:uncharacterized protein (DUF433 family)